MATKPTGRPRGRPKKEKTTTTAARRGRGRPQKALPDRADRHMLAFAQAALSHPGLAAVSDNRVLEHLVGLRVGWVVPTPKNIAAWRRGKPFLVHIEKRLSRSEPERAVGRRHENAVFALADDELGRPLRGYRTREPDDESRRWLGLMVHCWLICLAADVEEEWFARELAGLAGESAFFENVMRPVLRRFVDAEPIAVPPLLRHLMKTK